MADQVEKQALTTAAARIPEVPTTNPNLVYGLLFAILGTLVIYFIAFPPQLGYAHELLWNRGPIPPIETFFFSLAISVLILKYRLHQEQNRYISNPVVQGLLQRTGNLGPQAAETILASMPLERRSILLNRVGRCLQHYVNTQSPREVGDMNRSLAELDGEILESGYALLKFLAWLIPILGFLGTVLGIGAGIGGFEGLVAQTPQNPGELTNLLQDNMNSITYELSKAFDTTVLALIWVSITMLVLYWVQNREEEFLVKVDSYCIENLVNRIELVQRTGPQIDGTELLDRLQRVLDGIAGAVSDFRNSLDVFSTTTGQYVQVLNLVYKLGDSAGGSGTDGGPQGQRG